MTKRHLGQLFLGFVCIAIALMWVYAFIFAPRESANKINDSSWGQRANIVCESARSKRTALQDLRKINITDPQAMLIRADIAEKATATLIEMLDEIEKSPPTDAKGLELVPLWIADYRIYISNRAELTALMGQDAYDILAKHCDVRVQGIKDAQARSLPLFVIQHPATLQAGK